MSKGYILVDEPERCSQCDFWFEKSTAPVEYRCIAEQRELKNLNGRPDWCPIREMPVKKKPTLFTNNPFLLLQYSDYDKGWNDCIKQMEVEE